MSESPVIELDYYFAPQSPYTYLGHARFCAMARLHGCEVKLRPVDLGRVFDVTGGLPLAKRSAQRQDYRLIELRRHSDHLNVPLNLQPRFFPVSGELASGLLIAVDASLGTDVALDLQAAIGQALWVDEGDIADPNTLLALSEPLLGASTGDLLEEAASADIKKRYETYTDEAIARGVFGAPFYFLGHEPFYGQDRLEFLERALAMRERHA